jgi:hypothetical protein
MPNAVTTTDCFLEQISGQLAEQNALLGELVAVLRPEPPAEPESTAAPDDKPAAKPAKKAAAKKATTRRTVDGT